MHNFKLSPLRSGKKVDSRVKKNRASLNVEADLVLKMQPCEISHGRILSSTDLLTLCVSLA